MDTKEWKASFSEKGKQLKEKMKKVNVNTDFVKNINKEWFVENRKACMLSAFAVLSLVMILVSYFALSVPIVAVCSFVILETLLCALLNNTPIWVHFAVLVLQAAAGFYFEAVIFIVLMIVIYIAALLLLYVWTKEVN